MSRWKPPNEKFPQPVSYRRALQILFLREQPHANLLHKQSGQIKARLRKRPSVRLVADLFYTSPKQVANDLFQFGGQRAQNLAAMTQACESFMGERLDELHTPTKLLWATGRGAW